MANDLEKILNRVAKVKAIRETWKTVAFKFWIRLDNRPQRFEDFLSDTQSAELERIRQQEIIENRLGETDFVETKLFLDSAATLMRSVQKGRFQEETDKNLNPRGKSWAWKLRHRFLARSPYDDDLKSRSRVYYGVNGDGFWGQHASTCSELVGKVCHEFFNHYLGRDPGSKDVPLIHAIAAFHLHPLPIPSQKFVQKVVTDWRQGKCWRIYPWTQFFWSGGVKEVVEESEVTIDLDYALGPVEQMQKSSQTYLKFRE
jgi:hypothetical protein